MATQSVQDQSVADKLSKMMKEYEDNTTYLNIVKNFTIHRNL